MSFDAREELKHRARVMLAESTDLAVRGDAALMFAQSWYERSRARAVREGYEHPDLDHYVRMLPLEETLPADAARELRLRTGTFLPGEIGPGESVWLPREERDADDA